jgi:hypothetical protein
MLEPMLPANSRLAAKRPERLSAVILFAAGIALVLGANSFAAAYVTSERYIYYWDWSRYWLMFGDLGIAFRTELSSAIQWVAGSIKNDDYNVLPVLPLVPFDLVFGEGRLSYILAITNVALLPAAALLAWIAERTSQPRSWRRFLVLIALLLGLHVLWAPALRGLPDAFGLVLGCLVLLAYFHNPREYRLLRLVGTGGLLCLLILTRRWYSFWAVGFFVAAPIAHFLSDPHGTIDRRDVVSKLVELAIIGVVCAAFFLILAAPLGIRAVTTDYSVAYAAYSAPLVGGGPLSQIADHFGIALLLVCALGLGVLAVRPESRELAILLFVQAVVAIGLFSHVQSFLGVQHYYLLLPAAGIGLCGAVIHAWNARWRVLGIGGIFAIVILSSIAAFVPGVRSAPLLPRARFTPLVRPDLQELDRLMDALQALKPTKVYIAASSEVLNWSILDIGCRPRHRDLCQHITRTADIDARDGFPKGILRADYVVVGMPIQYHVHPKDQQVVGLVAEHIVQQRGIGSTFEPVKGTFRLMRGVRAQIFRRTAPLREEDIKALSEQLIRSYPHMERQFRPAT